MDVRRHCGIIVISLALAACAQFNLERVHPGMSSDQVRDQAGTPHETRSYADGSTVWYYVGGGAGRRTWKIVFDRSSQVSGVEQMLTIESFHKYLKPGITRGEEVLLIFGRPGGTERYPGFNEVVYTYRFLDGTLEMVCDIRVDRATGLVKEYPIYRDPAFTSGGDY